MGQAKQRKAIMGDRYGKDGNPWNSKPPKVTAGKSLDDFNSRMIRMFDEVSNEMDRAVVLASENIEDLDFSGFKIPISDAIKGRLIHDASCMAWEFEHGKSLNLLEIRSLSVAATVEEYKALVPIIPEDVALTVLSTIEIETDGYDEDECNEDWNEFPPEWPLDLKVVFNFHAAFVAGVYFSCLERSQAIDNLTLLKVCKLMVLSAYHLDIDSDE